MADKTEPEKKMGYAEMQDFFERTLKLETPPVAVKFIRKGEEKPKGLSTNIKPISFCQAVTVARQGNYSVYLTRENLSCPNARLAFGLGTPEEVAKDRENQILKFHNYAPNKEVWEKMVDKKFAIPPGEVTGVAVAPLARAKFIPDALIFTVVPWQAYFLMNGYFFMTGDVPLNFTMATNSLVCGYAAGIAGWDKKINMATACSGGRSNAGTESIHIYFALPWELVDIEIEGLKQRSKVAPYPGLITIPLGGPKPGKHFFKMEEDQST
ncbi:MAG: DUF169 domain-containing protein [Deltaproteobacteria bacterium]|nr:DUF169 domain-containing protein [Deltaproteobacteria bacterium]